MAAANNLGAVQNYATPTLATAKTAMQDMIKGSVVLNPAEPRFDRRTRTLELLGAWGDTSRLDEALVGLGTFLGAERIARPD